jgi:hypothetical protein
MRSGMLARATLVRARRVLLGSGQQLVADPNQAGARKSLGDAAAQGRDGGDDLVGVEASVLRRVGWRIPAHGRAF